MDVAPGAVYEMVERAVALRECGSERFAGGVIGQVELFGDENSGSVRRLFRDGGEPSLVSTDCYDGCTFSDKL